MSHGNGSQFSLLIIRIRLLWSDTSRANPTTHPCPLNCLAKTTVWGRTPSTSKMNHFFWPHRTNDTQDNDEPDSSSSSPERRQQRQDVGMNAPKAPLLCSDQHGGHGYHSPNTDRSIPATTLNVSKEPPSNEYVLVGPSQCRKQSLSSLCLVCFLTLDLAFPSYL